MGEFNILYARRLYALTAQIKELTEEAEAIKTTLKEELDVGIHLYEERKVLISEGSRESLDKDALIQLLGVEEIKKYTKTTKYKSITVK